MESVQQRLGIDKLDCHGVYCLKINHHQFTIFWPTTLCNKSLNELEYLHKNSNTLNKLLIGLFGHMEAIHTIKKKGIKVLLIGATALAIGCTSPYEIKELCNDLLSPDAAGSCGDTRAEVSAQKAEQRAMEMERSSVTVTTPEGYVVNLHVGSIVMYKGNEYSLRKLTPSNIGLVPYRSTSGSQRYSFEDIITIPISNLDMMQEK